MWFKRFILQIKKLRPGVGKWVLRAPALARPGQSQMSWFRFSNPGIFQSFAHIYQKIPTVDRRTPAVGRRGWSWGRGWGSVEQGHLKAAAVLELLNTHVLWPHHEMSLSHEKEPRPDTCCHLGNPDTLRGSERSRSQKTTYCMISFL